MRRLTRVAAALVLGAMASSPATLRGQSATDRPPEDSTFKPYTPAVPPPDRTPKAAAVPRVAPAGRDSGDALGLKGVQALSIKEGEARLRLAAGERTVRPGDAIGPDIVKTVTPGQIVLLRTASTEKRLEAATVVVRFDSAGRGRVRVYYEKETSPPPPALR